ncbi:hypothetical protein OH802_20975 [Nocardioides sp. NBC_00850]|uniref:hypothetical protein n=1 Tax=Nocardioides sp. NBC_00850 TaxID=2976001 RepID=UPI00386339D1|nr:hypothetical protein OH802_20975 [Nocardioides sp. NBC_00850]
MREDIEFDAEGVTLRGWFYRPDGVSGELPCIILSRGYSCTKEMGHSRGRPSKRSPIGFRGVLDGTVEARRVFDSTVTLDEVPDAYRSMDARESLKVLVTF